MMSDSQNSQGVRMFQQAYYQGAQQRFQQAVQTDPSNPDAYYNLARTYHQLGKLHSQPSDLQQAESYYHQCLDHDPNHQDCYRGLAVLLVEQSRSADAFKLVGSWAARNPSWPRPDRVGPAVRRVGQSRRRQAAVDRCRGRRSRQFAAPWPRWANCAKTPAKPRRRWPTISARLSVDPNQPQLASRVGARSAPRRDRRRHAAPERRPGVRTRWCRAPRGASCDRRIRSVGAGAATNGQIAAGGLQWRLSQLP